MAAATLGTLGCASSPGPQRWLPAATDTPTEAFGGWAEVALAIGDTLRGELLAASADSIWLMHGDRVVVLARSQVAAGRIIGWRAGATEITNWTMLGMLSTPSHGFFAVFSAPIWLLAGSTMSVNQAAHPVTPIVTDDWTRLAAWARFPQGIPPGMPLAALRPKPAAP